MKVVKIKQNTNKPFHILEKDTCQKHVQIRYDLLLLTLFQIIVDFYNQQPNLCKFAIYAKKQQQVNKILIINFTKIRIMSAGAVPLYYSCLNS